MSPPVTTVDALASLGAQLARGGTSLTFPGDADFGARLTLGQIIKGRVLRSFEAAGRHLVDFGGQQRIVDSAVPLRQDEVFHGRVVALGEQVQLQKLAAEPQPETAATIDPPRGERETLGALFDRYRAQVPAAQLESASALVARLPQPQTAGLAALVLAKLGLPLEPAWIRAVHARLVGSDRDAVERPSLRLETVAADAATPATPTQLDAAVAALAAALSNVVIDPSAARARQGSADGDRPPRDPAAWILNIQTRGSVAHRVGTLPLLVDGRLVELDVALFDEGQDQSHAETGADPLRHRQIVIALDTTTLGRVEVRARMVGTRMEVALATTSSEQTLALSLHSAHLGEQLRSLGWQVDGLSYSTRQLDVHGGPLHSVVEHIINPGSVSRLV